MEVSIYKWIIIYRKFICLKVVRALLLREITRFASVETHIFCFSRFSHDSRLCPHRTAFVFSLSFLKLSIFLLAKFQIDAATRARKNKRQIRYIKEIRNCAPSWASYRAKPKNKERYRYTRITLFVGGNDIAFFSRNQAKTYAPSASIFSVAPESDTCRFFSRKYIGKACTQFDLHRRTAKSYKDDFYERDLLE